MTTRAAAVLLAGALMLAPVAPAASAQSAAVVKEAASIINQEDTIRGNSATELLNSLTIRDADPTARYDRDSFGRWVDPDGNSCDTRNDILARDLIDVSLGDDGCRVLSGRMSDPYTGETIDFVRQNGSSSQMVEIDHVVSVADAWRSGAHEWDQVRKVAFYNDPLNLKATISAVNQDKSDQTADTWRPTVDPFGFADTQVRVKAKYGLSVTAAEAEALATALSRGPAEIGPAPDTGSVVDQTESAEIGPKVETGGTVVVSRLDRVMALFS